MSPWQCREKKKRSQIEIPARGLASDSKRIKEIKH